MPSIVVGGLIPSLPVAAASGPNWLVVLLAILGSSATAAAVNWLGRRRSGEGPAAAARDYIAAGATLVESSEAITVPLLKRIADLTTELATVTRRHADARIEVHEQASDVVTLAAKVATLEYELAMYRSKDARPGGRRADDQS